MATTTTPTTDNSNEQPTNNWWVATKNAADVVVSTFTGLLDQVNPWHLVEGSLYRHFYRPDVQAARILYSTVLTHYFGGKVGAPKVWTMVVAPPGSAKTELLHALDGLPRIHTVDSISPNTFISGQIGAAKPGQRKSKKESSSYLHRIGSDGILVFQDFSTILEMKSDHVATIFSQMRKIYDGKYSKEFGTPDDPDHAWEGRLTILAACTPSIDSYTGMFQSLGDGLSWCDGLGLVGWKQDVEQQHNRKIKCEQT